ncbi:MAG: response regulator [Psychrosphaera sp.]|nr:response regulator [Psychrosphaera sp.]
MAVNVLIVDDEYLARANLAVALEENCDWQVVGECDRGDGVMQSVEQLKPQVIFLDIRIPSLKCR